MTEKIIGVLGGMGPEATSDFFAKVIALTPAHRDQDHLRIIIDNNPKIPDRTEAILTGSKSLLPVLVETALNLQEAGADFIVIPCNTVHYYYDELVKYLSVPVLHIVRETLSAVKTALPDCVKVALLATTGTVASRLYQQEFQKANVGVEVPGPENQKAVMNAILELKAGKDKRVVKGTVVEIGDKLIRERKIQALVFGCTDIPLVVDAKDFNVPVFDSTAILAQAAVNFARTPEG